MSKFEGAVHGEAVRDIISAARGLGYKVNWGTIGISIRVPVPDRSAPMSVCWINPPGEKGWGGMTDVTLGYDSSTLALAPSAESSIHAFREAVAKVDGASPGGFSGVLASNFDPGATARQKDSIVELLAGLVSEIQRGDGTAG